MWIEHRSPENFYEGHYIMEWSTGSAQITSPLKQIPHFVYWLIPASALELCTELGDVYN